MKKQRNTKQRQLILDAVRAHCDHPSADQIYLDVRAVDNRISRGTVYRNLNLLAQNGELLHIKVPNADRFDYRLDFHYHFLCTECGAVYNVPLSYHSEMDQEVTSKTGHTVERHHTIFEGLCTGCRYGPKHG